MIFFQNCLKKKSNYFIFLFNFFRNESLIKNNDNQFNDYEMEEINFFSAENNLI